MTCPDCGGDGVTHLAVAHSLSHLAGVRVKQVLDMPCTLVNRLNLAILEAQRSVVPMPPTPPVDARAKTTRIHDL